MSISNLYEQLPQKYRKDLATYANYDKLQISLPNRFSIIAPSGFGKTNLTLNLIMLMNCFTKIYIIAKHFDSEPLYEWFIDSLHEMEERLSKKHRQPVKILELVSSDLADLPDADEFDADETNLVIFDDLVTETNKAKLKNMCDLWIRGRKRNVSCMYLSQNYFDIPKTMRKNTGILILKDLGTERDKRAILSEVAKDKDMSQMQAMMKASEPEKLECFFMIDTSCGAKKELRYRHNFTAFPEDFGK